MKKNNFISYILASFAIASTLCGDLAATSEQDSFAPYLQVGGTRFFRVSTPNTALEYDLFIPLLQDSLSDLLFADVRLYDRAGPSFEGNVHIGYRSLATDDDYLYGVYVAFDRKKTQYGPYYSQITVGGEAWFTDLFFGGNIYIPIGSKTQPVGIVGNSEVLRVVDTNVWINPNENNMTALGGADISFGYEFIPGLIGRVGGYYFGSAQVDTIYGPKANIQYDWFLNNGKKILNVFDKIGLEAGIQNDKVRGTSYYLSANFRVGLLPNRNPDLQGVARHMVDLVRRDVDIVTGIFSVPSNDPNFLAGSAEYYGGESYLETIKDKIKQADENKKVFIFTNDESAERRISEEVGDDLKDNYKIIYNPLNIQTVLLHGAHILVDRASVQEFMGRNAKSPRGVSSSIVGVPSSGATWVSYVTGTANTIATGALNMLWNGGSIFWNNIGSPVISSVPGVANVTRWGWERIGNPIMSGVPNTLSTVATGAKNAFRYSWENIGSPVISIVPGVIGFAAGVANMAWYGWEKIGYPVISSMPKAFKMTWDTLKNSKFPIMSPRFVDTAVANLAKATAITINTVWHGIASIKDNNKTHVSTDNITNRTEIVPSSRPITLENYKILEYWENSIVNKVARTANKLNVNIINGTVKIPW